MREYLPFLVIGLATGSVYAIAAMGLVVTYKTSGVFNFAHGAVGMFATFVFYTLRVDAGVPTWLAAAVAVLGRRRRLIGRRHRPGAAAPARGARRRRPTSSSPSGCSWRCRAWPSSSTAPATRQVEPIFSQATFRLPGVNVGYDQAHPRGHRRWPRPRLLALFFRGTQLGLQTRAVVDDRRPHRAGRGTSSAGSRRSRWMLGCAFAALSGVLLAPFLGLDAVLPHAARHPGLRGGGRRPARQPAAHLRSAPSASASAQSLATKFVAASPAWPACPTQPAVPRAVRRAGASRRKGTFVERHPDGRPPAAPGRLARPRPVPGPACWSC